MDERIVKLEEKLTHLERYLEELDSAVRDLFQKLETVQAEIRHHRSETHKRFDELARAGGDGDGTLEEPPPPHWGRK